MNEININNNNNNINNDNNNNENNNNENKINNSYDDILLELNESEKENEEELQTYINKINSIMLKEGIKINSIEDLYDDKIYIKIMNSLLSSQKEKEKINFINSQTQNEKIFNIKKILKHLSNDLDLPLNHIEPSSIIIEHEIETITFLLGLFYDLINYVKLKNEDVTTMPSENISVGMISKTVQLNESFCKNKILMECKMNDEDRKFINENYNNNNNENNINIVNNIKGDEFSLRDNNNKITLNSYNNQIPTSHFNDNSFSNKTNSNRFSTNKNKITSNEKKPILSNNYNFNIKFNESFNKKFSQQILNKSSLLQNFNQNNNDNDNDNNNNFPIFLSEDEILSKILNLIQQIFSKNEFESISSNKNFPLKIYSIYIKIHEFYYNLNSNNHPITNQNFHFH